MGSCCSAESDPDPRYKASGDTFKDGGKHTVSNDDKAVERPTSFVRENLSQGHKAKDEITASNKLAFAVKSSPFFHDILVTVSKYDEETSRDKTWNEEQDINDAKLEEERQKNEREKEASRTDVDRAQERKKEQKQRDAIEKQLRSSKEQLGDDEVQEEVDRRVAKSKGKKLQTEEAKREEKRSKDREEAYTKMVDSAVDTRPKTLVTPNRPSMAAAIRFGDKIQTHSSVKGEGKLDRHTVVQQVLDKMVQLYAAKRPATTQPTSDRSGKRVGKPKDEPEPWHGFCAEVGAVSDYLHHVDPKGRMTLQDAKAHFQKHEQGCKSVAHRPEDSDGTSATEISAMVDPCRSCTFMLNELGIEFWDRGAFGKQQKR